MWLVIGALGGAFVGLAQDERGLAVVLALVGAIVGWALDRRQRRSAAPLSATVPLTTAPPSETGVTARRLDALEARLARLEAHLGLAAPSPEGVAVASPAPPPPRMDSAPAPARPLVDPAPRAVVPPARRDDAPPPRPAYGVRSIATASVAAPGAAPAAGLVAGLPGLVAAVRDWLAGGNTLTRVGIVVLFFGVAFLLRHFVDLASVPIAAKLGAVGAGGVALAGLGIRLARGRPAYGLSLQGAGMGVIYLTAFAAFRLHEVLAPMPAIALLIGVAAATIFLALRHDAQPLAALALAGGFLAPILIQTGSAQPAPLFAWFAVLDAAIFAVAWRRHWRALDLLGFVFTFALGLAWGWWFYRPAHYATVQPFLALFFLFYVGIAILHARNATPGARAPVDGVLVFGVPLVGFALQAGIVGRFDDGTAWSAAALAAFYAALWALLRARPQPGLARLAKAFAALAVVFATLSIPLALDARWTSAGWAVEAAAVYWLGVVQRQRAARWFALAVVVAATAAFAWSVPSVSGPLFANAAFVGLALIGLAALCIVYVADRHPDVVGGGERGLLWIVLGWGLACWSLAGLHEMERRFDRATAVNAAIAWIAATALLALAARHLLRWPRIAWAFAIVLPALVMGGALLFDLQRTTLAQWGWLAWPLAWAVHGAGLRSVDADCAADERARKPLADLHAVTALAVVGWLAWEASEWVGRTTEEGSVWIACAAALPPIAYLAAVTLGRGARAWPMRERAAAYGRRAGSAIALALAAWFVGVNVVSPGDPYPLPWLPLANPLDVTLALALVVAWHWAGVWARWPARPRAWAGGLAAFIALNGAIVRAAHHLGDVAWHATALFGYRPLQAALTLAWTLCALALMMLSTRRGIREGWLAGAALLAVVVAKLFLLDLAALSGLTRVTAFLGVGALLLVIGYVAPLPPARDPPRALGAEPR